MDPEDLVAYLLALPDKETRRQALQEQLPSLNDQQIESLVQRLRDAHREYQFSDAQRSLQTVELIADLGACLHDDTYLALGYRLTANAYTIGFGQYEKALLLYDRAEKIFTATNNDLELARMQIVRIWALSFTDGYAEAVRWGDYAYPILEKHGDVRSLSLLVNNLASVHNRFGALDVSLQLLNDAHETLRRLGDAGRQYLPNTIANRVFVLSLLGRYSEAIEAAQEGLALAEQLGQSVVYARLQHNVGLTYYMLGHYTQALHLFDQAQAVRLADGRYHRYVQGELTTTFCLLRLRRFTEVIERCRCVRQLCREHDVTPETPFSLLNEALAYAGLGRFEDALRSLDETRAWMATQGEGGSLNAAEADLVKAELLYEQGNWRDARAAAFECVQAFDEMKRLQEVAQAYLIAARSATALQDLAAGRDFARASLAISEPRDISTLVYEGYAVLGQIAEITGEPARAFDHYQRAIITLKRIQGQMMLEFRPDFLADRNKEQVFEAMVGLCLASNEPHLALKYVEEAKSRALLDLIAHRLDLRVEARVPGDETLVSELNRLSARRNALCRQMLSEPGATDEITARRQDIEGRITELRNKLLVRNADYARDLSPVEESVEDVSAYLADDALLVEFYSLRDGMLAFCVTAQTPNIRVYRLPSTFSQIKRWQQRLQVNLKTVPHSTASHIPHLIRDAQMTLQHLQQDLLAPLAGLLATFKRLIVVPHASLHYVPFHALFDGEKYLIETHEVSYLPASSFLRYGRDMDCSGQGMLAVGYSHRGRLPHAVAEARQISERWQAALVCEDEATRERVQALMAGRRIIHLATHGEFRHDTPLFSGLALADGWLSTLDVFDLRLNASLVTLSGCHTGRSIVGGGDELLGLMRAFLAAGAASLILSQWATEDRATAFLMDRLYERLNAGVSKSAALQAAQLGLLREETSLGDCCGRRHPFFWAPFYLVGDQDAL